MNDTAILPTANHEWGFWGTSIHNGYDAPMGCRQPHVKPKL